MVDGGDDPFYLKPATIERNRRFSTDIR